MSSALKPALPPAGGQTSPGSAPIPKSMPGAQGPMPGVVGPSPYGQPLGHMPAAGLPHAHPNMGANSTANMSSNAMPQMGGGSNATGSPGGVHPGVVTGQPPAHASSAKSTALPPASAAGLARPPIAHPPYMSPPGTVPHPRDEEGTTLPPSQNSAQLMAVHRASQQHHNPLQMPQHHQQQQQQQHHVPPPQLQHEHHPQQQQPQQQQQQINIADRFKQQQSLSLVQQPQANGTATGPNEPVCHKTIVPAPPTISGDIKPSGTSPSNVVHNHVPVGNETPDCSSSATNAAPIPIVAAPAADHTTNADTNSTHQNTVKQQQQQQPVGSSNARDVPKVQSTMKLATTPRTNRKQRDVKPVKPSESPKAAPVVKTPDNKQQMTAGMQKSSSGDGGKAKGSRASDDERKSKRTRTRTQPYQSPIPELALITKLSGGTPTRGNDEKLIVFYKNEFLAVRNAEGGFYVCQAVQNVYKSSPRIRIRWLSQDKQDKIYIPDFYDFTDFDCILTNLNMERVEKGKYNLPKDELERTENILKRALAVESGASAPSLTEEHPDGLDLSLFRDESQLKKKRKSTKRKSTEPLSASDTNSKVKRTPDKSKMRRMSKSPAKSTRKNNQPMESRRSASLAGAGGGGLANDKRDSVGRTPSSALRRSDGGRAERAKRRGESANAADAIASPKTSPVVDQKKARVLAKVVLKTAIPAASVKTTAAHNKKKGTGARSSSSGASKSAASAVVAAAAAATRAGIKAATRSQGTTSGTTAALAAAVAAVAAAASNTPSTRRAKKGRK